MIHAPVLMKKREQFDKPEFGIDEYSKMYGYFTQHSWNAEFDEKCKPSSKDIVLRNRTNYSAFQGTGLHSILENFCTRRVFLMGFVSNACIEETACEMRDIFPDMEIYILTDGSAAMSKQVHNDAITISLPAYGNCITCEEAVHILNEAAIEKTRRKSRMSNAIGDGSIRDYDSLAEFCEDTLLPWEEEDEKKRHASWDRARECLKKTEGAASVAEKDWRGDTALHIACRRHAPMDFINMVLDIGGELGFISSFLDLSFST